MIIITYTWPWYLLWYDDLSDLKVRNEAAVAEAETKVADLERQARELTSKAKDIKDAVYDLKAVNPHKKAEVDTRTPGELIELIDAKGREITEALVSINISVPVGDG